jgi:hypothetical protein
VQIHFNMENGLKLCSFSLIYVMLNFLSCSFTYIHILSYQGPSWSWSYGSWIYNYLCNRCLSPLTLWVGIPFRRGVLDTTLCDEVCQWLATGQWFSPSTPVSYTNEIDRHDITEIFSKVSLSSINLNLYLHPYLFLLKISIICILY